MSADTPNTPDAPGAAEAEGLWLSITELAERKNLGKAAVSERVSGFEARGLLTTRAGKGRAKLVNLAEFDRVAGEVTDLAREQGAATKRQEAPDAPPGPESASATYTREQARKMAYSADIEKLALGEKLRLLVPVDRLREETQALFAPIVTRLDRLEARADDVAAAVARDGVAGGRAFLKALKFEIRNDIADGLAELAAKLTGAAPRPLDDFDPSLALDPGSAVEPD